MQHKKFKRQQSRFYFRIAIKNSRSQRNQEVFERRMKLQQSMDKHYNELLILLNDGRIAHLFADSSEEL